MKIAIINESYPAYNLATEKMRNYFMNLGHDIYYSPRADAWARGCIKAMLSVIFTWHLPKACQDVRILSACGCHVEIGGPAVTAMPEYVRSMGSIAGEFNRFLQIKVGLDARFEHTPGDNYKAVFTSRGCPRGCDFCLVQRVEGRQMIEYDDFPIPTGRNPFVCDNNILATSWAHQALVVQKLKHVKNLDLNSGFDDRIFARSPERYWQLYDELDIEAWRFAYDSPEQKEPLKHCVDFLHDRGVDYRHIIVFCLVGYPGETFDYCREKLQYLIDIGTSPYPMRYRPVDSISDNYTPPSWNPRELEILFGYERNNHRR